MKGEKLSILVRCALNLAPCRPPRSGKTARPTADRRRRRRAVRSDADRRNTYIFAVRYQRLVNPVAGAVALGTLLAAATLPAVAWVVTG
ncbi:hypothetical protein WI560_27495 [Bradyrhizobium sp. A11]|uniref:hypothetical protein n=1 Tax=Bradyrhizobium sp. A11 TaxID=3133974 RepID=UPI0032505BCC